MNSEQIQEAIYQWALGHGFTAPYGVLKGTDESAVSRIRFKSVTFGYARTLDATVNIYNRNFIVVRTNRHGSNTFKSYDQVMKFLEEL